MAIAELLPDESLIVIHTDWREKNLIKQVPGAKWDSRASCWTLPVSWSSCVVLRGVFGPALEIGRGLNDWLWRVRQSWIDNGYLLRENLELHPDDHHPWADQIRSWRYTEGSILYPFQEASVRFATNALAVPQSGILDASDMGTGKSAVGASSLRLLEEAGHRALPLLIVCPNSVKHNWASELRTWLPFAIPFVIEGGAANRRKQIELAKKEERAAVIINIEAIRLHSRVAPYGSIRLSRCAEHGGSESVTAARCEVHEKDLNTFPFKSVILDEAHRCLNPQAKQTRAVWWMMHQAGIEHRIALTGTPIANNVADLWSILHAIAPDDFPTKSTFIDRYALMAWNRFAALDIVGVRPDTSDELQKILQPRFRRVLKRAVLPQLPAKVREVRHAPMSQNQARMYQQMEEQLVAETEEDGGDLVISPSNLTKVLRLMQFSSASAEIIGERQVRLKEPSSKLDVLEEVIAEAGTSQLAVCAASRQLIELAAVRLEKAKITHRLLTGAIPPAIRDTNVREFQNGDAQVMLFTIAAGGVGINLTAADTIVFLQRSWSMLENRQAEDRVHRIGSERHESITIIDIVAPNTVEIRQINRLLEKSMRLEEIVRDRDRLTAAGVDVDTEILSLEAGLLT